MKKSQRQYDLISFLRKIVYGKKEETFMVGGHAWIVKLWVVFISFWMFKDILPNFHAAS